MYLKLLQSPLLLYGGAIVGDQKASRVSAFCIVLHMESDGPPSLGASADMIELESHQALHEGAFPIRLMADDEDGRGIKRLLEVLSEAMEVVVCLVQLLVARGRVELARGAREGHLLPTYRVLPLLSREQIQNLQG